MDHVAYSPKNRLFEPISGRFTPSGPQSAPRAAWATDSGHCAPASRPTLNQRGEVVCRPFRRLPPATDSRVPHNSPARGGRPKHRRFGARADGDGITSPSPLVIGNSPWRRCLQGAAHLGIGPPGSYHRVYDTAGLDGWLGDESRPGTRKALTGALGDRRYQVLALSIRVPHVVRRYWHDPQDMPPSPSREPSSSTPPWLGYQMHDRMDVEARLPAARPQALSSTEWIEHRLEELAQSSGIARKQRDRGVTAGQFCGLETSPFPTIFHQHKRRTCGALPHKVSSGQWGSLGRYLANLTPGRPGSACRPAHGASGRGCCDGIFPQIDSRRPASPARKPKHEHPTKTLDTGKPSIRPSRKSSGTERVSGTHPSRLSGTHLGFQNSHSGQERQAASVYSGFGPSWISSTRGWSSSRH